jgi:WD40 repeat protein
MSHISLKHIFGLKGDVKDNIHYIDESNVLYPAGYNIVSYNVEKKTQRFLTLLGSSSSDVLATGDISAMCVSTSSSTNKNSSHLTKAKVLAVAERGENGKANVSVFDLATFKRKGKNVLASSEIASHEFVSLAFSPDGKYLLTQGGAPDWTLANWQWEKSKIVQIAKVSNSNGAQIHQVSFCPSDPSVVCVTGNGILRFLHIEQNEFKSIPFSMGKREPQNYLCHAWIDDRVSYSFCNIIMPHLLLERIMQAQQLLHHLSFF